MSKLTTRKFPVHVRRGGQTRRHDLRSANGTYLRKSRGSVVRLEPMPIFRIGASELQLRTT